MEQLQELVMQAIAVEYSQGRIDDQQMNQAAAVLNEAFKMAAFIMTNKGHHACHPGHTGYFPIVIQIHSLTTTENGQAAKSSRNLLIRKPEDLPCGEPFTVILTNVEEP